MPLPRSTPPNPAAPTRALALGLLLLSTLIPSPSSAQPSPHPAGPGLTQLPAHALLARKRPLVIGHRGYAALAPENTLASFHHALLAGVDLVELDYHHSQDGVPIVVHDGTLDRTTDAIQRWGGKGIRVDSRTAADLLSLTAGNTFSPPFPDEFVPTLVNALEFIQGRGVTLIERKAGDAQTLAELLRNRRLLNHVVVQAFDWQFLREFHQLVPDQVLGALGPPSSREGRKLTDPEKVLGLSWLTEIKALGAHAAVWNSQVDADSIRIARQLGLKVWVYTVNDADRAAALLALGVDAIITDNPALIWRAVALASTLP